ncbi:MAG: alcohol dehydrogenase catalytic domain-containing protein [Phycisphaerae bacterium]
MNDNAIPQTQHAVQLVGPDKLELNTEKSVPTPGPHQILARVEAVGLCFSDLKLLKQFSDHPRKSEIVRGIDFAALSELPSYVPGEEPTVPGHEVVCDILQVGEEVTHYSAGERVLVQADWRFLKTAGSNGAFGYNFEGGLQEYVLFDERVVVDPETDERFLVSVEKGLSSSAVCLVEPWACVEDSYVTNERQTVKAGGKLLVVRQDDVCCVDSVSGAFSPDGKPAEMTVMDADLEKIAELDDQAYDDIIYFGTEKETIDALNDKLAIQGIFNIVLCNGEIGEKVSVGVGRVHYGMTRWIGTPGCDAAESYKAIPETGEIADGDRVMIVGAGGPMGQMHTIRTLACGKKDLKVVATDLDDSRLESLETKTRPVADANGVEYRLVNTKTNPLDEKFTYFELMAPIGALVEQAIDRSMPGTRINIFAGIPAPTRHDLDMDRYIRNGCFMFGTSGSTIEDMKIVLRKVTDGQLETNLSVDAVSGMAGAVDGIKAVEQRTMAGKIIVYPELHELPLTPLDELGEKYPSVAEKFDEHGNWTRDAEEELLRVAK